MQTNTPLPAAAPGKLSVLAVALATVPADGADAASTAVLRRPVAAGFARATRSDQGRWSFALDSAAAIPDTAVRLLNEIDSRIGGADIVVTYGSPFAAATIPFAALRERHLRMRNTARASNGERTGDIDLAEMLFADQSEPPPLATVLRGAGVPVLSGDADPAALWREDDISALRAAVLGEAVGALMLSWLVHAFADAYEAIATRPLAALARHLETADGPAHLKPLVASDLARWARSRAMRADVADALARTEARIGSGDAEPSFAPPR